MGNDHTLEMPAVWLYIADEGRAISELAAAKSNLRIEIRGETFLESAEPPFHLAFDLSPWQTIFATWMGTKVLDGAYARIAPPAKAYIDGKIRPALRAIGRTLREFCNRADRKAFGSISVTDFEGNERQYELPGDEPELAAESILQDLMEREITDPSNHVRFWIAGQWIGGSGYHRSQNISDEDLEDALHPDVEVIQAMGAVTDILGRRAECSIRGHDVILALPPDANSELRERILTALRKELPDYRLGLDASRERIVIHHGASKLT